MQKAFVRLILTLFILGIINPGIGHAVTSNTDLNDYYQSCINKQSQVLPLVKNVHLKISIAGPDYCFIKPSWAESVAEYQASGSFHISPKQLQNIHYQQYLQLLLYPPHFFG